MCGLFKIIFKKYLKFYVIILFLKSASYIQSQEDSIDIRANYVTASGLRLRESPNQNSKILSVIPFGSRVEYLTIKNFGKDTNEFELKNYTNKIIGTWVHVKFNKIRGYVLNSYLSYYNNSIQEHSTKVF